MYTADVYAEVLLDLYFRGGGGVVQTPSLYGTAF